MAHLVALGADDVCIRTPVYYLPYKPEWHSALVAALPDDIEVSLWPVVSLYNPEAQADKIAEEAEKYQPDRIYLDAERHWVLDYIANLPRFLNRLAAHKASGRIKCPIGLGSYRRASGWSSMHWQVWWTHKLNGVFTIDFVAMQLYPEGWNTPTAWRSQMRMDVDSHQLELNKANRPDLEWLPFMAAYTEHGWTPKADCVEAGVDELHKILGNRLLGFNWWSLDQNLVEPQHAGQYAYIASLASSPAVPPAPTIEERLADLETRVTALEAE